MFRRVCLLYLSLLIPFVYASEIATNEYSSRYGLLRSAKVEGSDSSVIYLNNKMVYSKSGEVIYLHNAYKIGGNDIVVFSTWCGGSVCPMEYGFLVINKSKVDAYSSEDASPEDSGEVLIKQDGLRVLIDLGLASGKRKFYVFDGDNAKIYYSNSIDNLPEEKCIHAFAFVKEVCTSSSEDKSRCEMSPITYLSDLERNDYKSFYNYGGFSNEKFNEVCIKLCYNNNANLDYKAFRESVCGIK